MSTFSRERKVQVAKVLGYAHENQVEAFLEPTVELCLSLLEREMSEARRQPNSSHPPERGVSTGANVSLAANVLSHVMFCAQGAGTALASLAADCLLLLSQARASQNCNNSSCGRPVTFAVCSISYACF